MRIYISGQITGLSLFDAEDKFLFAQNHLTSQGHFAINPMNVLPFDPKHTWEDYMLADIKELFTCDGIFMLSNWGNSKGARIEHAIAREMGIFITYQSDLK